MSTDGTANSSEKILGILLAAGAGTRFSGPSHKLLASLHGRRIVDLALDNARAAISLSGLIVVTGAAFTELGTGLDTELGTELGAGDGAGQNVTLVHNPRWREGQATSLHVGITTAAAQGADAVVVGLADQPFVRAEAWDGVARTDAPIAVATYDGRRGNPVRLDRSVWPLLDDTGDHGARNLMALRPDLVREVACSGSAADIDTMEDLRQWNSSTNSP